MAEKVIVIQASGIVHVREVEDGAMLDGLQEIVGGYIEIVRPVRLERPLVLVCNEEGLLEGLPVNPVASYLYGADRHGNPIVGDVAILQEGYRDGEPDIEGIPDGVIEQVLAQLVRIFKGKEVSG